MDEQVEVSSTTYDPDWLLANRTTAEELENRTWMDDRNKDIEAGQKLKTTLSYDYSAYQKQIDDLEPAQRLELADRLPEEVVAILDDLAAGERDQKRQEANRAKDEEEQEEAKRATGETAQQSHLRHTYAQKMKEISPLAELKAKYQRMNEIRDDPTNEGSDELTVEQFRDLREGRLPSKDQEIANIEQQIQTKLQEAALAQAAYHEANRANQPPPQQPIGQFNGMPLTRDDIQSMVQLELDEQAHQERLVQAHKQYPDLEQVCSRAAAEGVDCTPQQAAFIKSLPNSTDVLYYLMTHLDEAKGMMRMSNADATRTLINISHKARGPAETELKKSNAPKPVSIVGNGGSRGAFDVNDESLSADEWNRQRQAQLARKKNY